MLQFLLQRNIPQSAIDALVQGGCMSLNDLHFLDEDMLNAMHIYKPFERKKLLMLSTEVVSPSAKLEEVSLVLCNAGILSENAQRYAVMLARQGFDSPEKLAEITEDDLAVCGITSRFDVRLILTLQTKLSSPSPAVRRQSFQPMVNTPVDDGQGVAALQKQLRLEEEERAREEEEKQLRLQEEEEQLRLQEEEERAQREEQLRMQLEEEARVCAELERMRLEREEQDRLEREEMERRKRPQRQDGTCSYLTNEDIAELLDEIAISTALPAVDCTVTALVEHFKLVVREHLPSGTTTPPKMLVEYSHLRVIYRWIAENIAFDFDSNKRDTRAEDVLLSRKANCFGYCTLLQAMATEIGLEMRTCHGYIKHETFQVGDELTQEHCWNLVVLGAKRRPFLLDVTLSAGTTSGGELFARKWQPHYFLCPSNLFILDHLPFEPKNQLLVWEFSPEQVSNFPICRADFFTSKMQLVSHFEHGLVECLLESNVEMEFRLDTKWRIKIPMLREIGSGEICENCPTQNVLRRRKSEDDDEDGWHTYTVTMYPPKMRGDYDLTIYVAHADNVNAASWAVSYLFRAT